MGNERGSRKRADADTDAQMERPQKRPKPSPRVDRTVQNVQSVQVYHNFRFLELPAELRNRIYEYATEDAFKYFPTYLFRKSKTSKATRTRASGYKPSTRSSLSSSISGDSNKLVSEKSIPYLALTQTCMQIRTEFRPMWLSTHIIPLNLTTTYFKTFFPMRLPKSSFKPLNLSTPSLRICIRRDEINSNHLDDVTRLFKHKARFPGSIVTCHSLPYWNEKILPDLDRVINHSNSEWSELVCKGRISQIRLGIDTLGNPRGRQVAADIVVKERFAEPWMRATLGAPPKDELDRFLERLGFAPGSITWRVKVFVDYS